jgi:hypothetical protein
MYFPYIAQMAQPAYPELEESFMDPGATEIVARDEDGVLYDIDVAGGTSIRMNCDGKTRCFRWAAVGVDYQPAAWLLVGFDAESRQLIFLLDEEDETPNRSAKVGEHHVHRL